jgi:hypothetical protein
MAGAIAVTANKHREMIFFMRCIGNGGSDFVFMLGFEASDSGALTRCCTYHPKISWCRMGLWWWRDSLARHSLLLWETLRKRQAPFYRLRTAQGIVVNGRIVDVAKSGSSVAMNYSLFDTPGI